eukprot:TRINITY_DN1251_c4_g1_i1.p1 TRINITY_DN1251_c4_g1~~TRINITY_DN1251_c4_g1_i1.p1  ORF type:complete len:456 (+),score=80.62 TRINITY_DN1251_c4_g1_i1:126-1493(+)
MAGKISIIAGILALVSLTLFAFNFLAVGGVSKERRQAARQQPFQQQQQQQRQQQQHTPPKKHHHTKKESKEHSIPPSVISDCPKTHQIDTKKLEHNFWKLLNKFTEIDTVEQSSAKFKDYPDKSPKWKVPTASESQSASCSTTEIFISEKEDLACQDFLSNFANWGSIQTLPSVLSIARTIKFRITFTNGMKAILKVPQKKFLFEPYSEFISYQGDRLLNFNKVPVTVLLPIPVSWLRGVASMLEDGFYTYWIETFVFNFSSVKKNIATGRCPFPESETVMCSVQLWMDGVQVLHETKYRPKGAMKKLLKSTSDMISEVERPALADLSNLMVFDYIISNSDRSEKNTFAISSDSGTSIILLDQGSSFYSRDPPRGHPLRHTAKHNTSICVFASSTVSTLRKFSKAKTFEDSMRKRLHSADGFWKPWQLKSAQQRISSLVSTIQYCEDTYPKATRL